MDPVTALFLAAVLGLAGIGLIVYASRNEKKKEEVVPESTLDHTNCKYCGTNFEHHLEHEDEEDDALPAITLAEAAALAEALSCGNSGGPLQVEDLWTGDGGQFSGAGASGSYDDSSSSSSDSSSDSSSSDSSSDSSSSDSGSSDSGSSGDS